MKKKNSNVVKPVFCFQKFSYPILFRFLFIYTLFILLTWHVSDTFKIPEKLQKLQKKIENSTKIEIPEKLKKIPE